MPTQYWRSPETIDHLNRLERPGFAVEFLRRNAEYRRDYAQIQRQIARDHVDAESARAGFARRWGLRFRSRPEQPGRRRTRCLAARTVARYAAARCSTERIRACGSRPIPARLDRR
ncbi:transcriptional regulator domain-containing protein [Acidiphilium sp.]|uniref:transcriptional regulator domain-containing protein n=1 Tax=Acidiphilium sp. TaxID=527 RepID=UPI002CBD4555|nr:DUF6499 domain-containing protein [Acidiphilium sp.]HQT62668.1 DUF6499 domain-containing protein [Acidiphilium sp.]